MDKFRLYQLEKRDIENVHRFKLTHKIADGGMGSVYRAILYGANGFEKVVVIKTLRERIGSDKKFIDMFIGEAKLVADLVHQNIVQIYHLDKFDDLYYIAMEHVNGINFQQFISRHKENGIKVPLDLGVFLISRVCRGLEYAHTKRDIEGQLLGVVHRDISPTNLMIDTEGEVKITDFGVAKARNLMRDYEGEFLIGKMQYMSPEQGRYQETDQHFTTGNIFCKSSPNRSL